MKVLKWRTSGKILENDQVTDTRRSSAPTATTSQPVVIWAGMSSGCIKKVLLAKIGLKN